MPEPVVEKKTPAVEAAPAAHKASESHPPRAAAPRKPVASGKQAAARPHFSRPAAHSRDRKPAQASSGRPIRRVSAEGRTTTSRTSNGARPASTRWNPKAAASSNGKRNGTHDSSKSNGRVSARPSNGSSGTRPASASASSWNKHKVHANGAKSAGKPVSASRNGSAARTNGRKPALTAGAKAGNSKRFGFTAPPKKGTKKRG